MAHRSRFAAGALALVGALVAATVVTRPPARITLDPMRPAGLPQARGVFHVHTVKSDGTGTLDEVAAAARTAGLDFVIIADHGDGTRPVEPPSYRSGVLCVEAVELSTAQGHFAAIGLPPVPYPLRGAPEEVVEDVRRLGAFGIVTHPESPKDELAWRAWSAPIDGLEWVNADSEWRDERWPALAGMLWRYPWRSTESLAALVDDTGRALSRWDRLIATRRVVALAGVDAHGGLAVERSDGPNGEYRAKPILRAPSYISLFRLLDNLVLLPRSWSGDAARDAQDLIASIRRGRLSSAVAGFAAPASVWLSIVSGSSRAWMGETIWPEGPLRVEVTTNAPAGSRIVVKRNGSIVQTGVGPTLVCQLTPDRGAVRAEVWLGSAEGSPPTPWAVTNPVYVAYAPEAPSASTVRWTVAEPSGEHGALATEPGTWRIERDSTSRVSWTPQQATGGGAGVLAVTLGRGGPGRGPYGALAVPLARGALAFDTAVEFEAHADRPCRLSLQLRAADPTADRRWRRSLYLDGTTRTYRVPVAELESVVSAEPLHATDLGAIDVLLFVVDSTNLDAGDDRSVTLFRPRSVSVGR